MNKRLYRSRTDKKISGVCAGIAEYFGIDPTIIRIIWALVTLATVFPGVVLYIICAFVIPEEPTTIDGEYRERD